LSYSASTVRQWRDSAATKTRVRYSTNENRFRRGYVRNDEKWTDGMAFRRAGPNISNPLRRYFKSVGPGPGVWKWDHYLDIYHRHFEKFRGRPVNILEIGIYSGGSLGMWLDYFGPHCHVYGVDIEESCKAYETNSVTVFVGDQGDREFWRRFKASVKDIDIIIDDGGHLTDQQIVTLEEMLPHLRPGGVYVCEDVHGTDNGFLFYMDGFSHNLHGGCLNNNIDDAERRIVTVPTAFQSHIQSVHSYPFIVVIEKRDAAVTEFVAPKRGTQWQPFLK
jgi:SAM-dependent methyltransferase